MTRWKAAGTHLLLSILVIGTIAGLAFTLWYPDGLHRIAGLDRLLIVMLVIDITAGPTLTAIVYKPGKRGLKFDLMMIALFQMAFLAYGLNTLRLARPVFLVGTPDQFTLVFASEIDDDDLALAPTPELRRLSWSGPRLVGTRMPTEPEARARAMDEFMRGGAGIERSPKYYFDYPRIAPELLASAQPVEGVADIPERDVRATGRSRTQLRRVDVSSTRDVGVMLLDARTGEPLRTVAADL